MPSGPKIARHPNRSFSPGDPHGCSGTAIACLWVGPRWSWCYYLVLGHTFVWPQAKQSPLNSWFANVKRDVWVCCKNKSGKESTNQPAYSSYSSQAPINKASLHILWMSLGWEKNTTHRSKMEDARRRPAGWETQSYKCVCEIINTNKETTSKWQHRPYAISCHTEWEHHLPKPNCSVLTSQRFKFL